jgi:UDP:flavonoid glycosyltransferase YjiC (YdhE family)
MSERLRVMLGAVAWTGHAFPVFALARELHARGHEVLVETIEGRRELIEGLGLRFAPAEPYMTFPGVFDDPRPDGTPYPTVGETARSLVPMIKDFRPDVVVTDVLTLAPALAAQAARVRHATLVPHVYPVSEPGLPFYLLGLLPPRTSLGTAMWRAIMPLQRLDLRLRWLRRTYNQAREDVGLQPVERFHGMISEQLTMVGTFPHLEYPRPWPEHVHVTGPMLFEPAESPEIQLPEGEGPLVVVNPSTWSDPEFRLVRAAIDALEGQAVRIVVTLSGRGENWTGRAPENAVVVDWISYEQVLPKASLIVSVGGHGTVVRGLAHGVPVLVCAKGGDMAENGARLTWTGAGLMLPRYLLRAQPMRWAIRRMLADHRFSARARAIARWSREHDGAALGATLVERLARR